MPNTPFEAFGKKFKKMREAKKESLTDLAETMELDEALLHGVEAGVVKPSEDIVQLLINHYSLSDSESEGLWRLAGYEDREEDEAPLSSGSPNVHTIMLQIPDVKIAYTDMVNVSANNFGVIINFLQGIGPDGKPMVVSRVGMSKEHANSLIDLLQKTMQQAEEANKPSQPKQLGESEKTS